MNALGFDPKNLEFDFKRDWNGFQGSRMKLFLVAWLQKELRESWRVLESVSPADLGKSQGAIVEIKKMLNLIERPHYPDDVMKDVLTFIEKKDKNYAG